MSNTLKKDYLENGQERVYRLDEDGKEWFYYVDNRTKFTVRAVTTSEEDINELFRISKVLDVEYFKEAVLEIDRDGKANQTKDIWVVEDENGNPACAVDVCFRKTGEIEVSFSYKNAVFKKLYEKNVRKTLANLGENEFKCSIINRLTLRTQKSIYIQK